MPATSNKKSSPQTSQPPNKIPTVLDALTTVPRVRKEDWNKLSFVCQWLIATRAGVLVMTFISAFISILWSFRLEKFLLLESALVVIGLLLAHATNNLLNDFVDWKKGVDQNNYFRNKYGTHPMSVMKEQQFLQFLFGTGLAALSVCLVLIYLKGETVFYLSLAGSFFLLFYTWPLKYYGLGEISVLVVWGYLMICGGYYTITSEWDDELFYVSVPYSICVTCVLFGKHIDKSSADQQKGIHTLPVILGSRASRLLTIFFWVLMYLIVLGLIVKQTVSWVFLIVFLSVGDLKAGTEALLGERPTTKPDFFPDEIWPLYYVAYCFKLTRSFGSLYLLALLIDTLFLHSTV